MLRSLLPTLLPTNDRRLSLPLIGLGLAMLYVVGLDNGHVMALFQGHVALDQNFIHELVHDARHAAGFPCH